MSRLYKITTGCNVNKKEIEKLSERVNKSGYNSRVIRLLSGAYTVYVMLTKDKMTADKAKEIIEASCNSKVAVQVIDDKD